MLIYLDLKKAFDSIDRKKLLQKLECVGICGTALAWFTSYLTGRRQFVSICGQDSDLQTVDYGVVQGSTLGPILFLIYINNISKLNLNGRLFLFADDTLLLLKGKNWLDVKNKAEQDLFILQKWFDQNILSVNIAKTKFMPISLSNITDYNHGNLYIHKCNSYQNISCDCESIELVHQYKYLGVIFDRRMSWSSHIEFLTKKIYKYGYAFRQLKEVLELSEMKKVYFGYIQSLLIFGNIAWGGVNITTLNPLFTAQKKIIKIAFNKPLRYPTETLFKEIAILTVRKLFVKSLLVYMFCNINSIFSVITHSHNTRYARSVGIRTIQLNKTFSKTNSFYIANVIYRNICQYFENINIFNSHSLQIFKTKVNSWLLELDNIVVESVITSDYRPV